MILFGVSSRAPAASTGVEVHIPVLVTSLRNAIMRIAPEQEQKSTGEGGEQGAGRTKRGQDLATGVFYPRSPGSKSGDHRVLL